jgi:hypothetical protein
LNGIHPARLAKLVQGLEKKVKGPMLPNPHLIERLSEEYRKDRLREAEHERQARNLPASARKPIRLWDWMMLPVILVAVLIWLAR